jgi:acyl-CoA thioesterase FadM
MRVLPSDLDVFGHMNNSRYLSVMDLGRLDLITRVGLTQLMFRHHWYPIVGASRMQYRRSLNLWQRYDVKTRMVDWDDKWFYLEQQFIIGEQIHAVGWIKGIVRGREGNIKPQDILKSLGLESVEKPILQGEIADWVALEHKQYLQTKNNR